MSSGIFFSVVEQIQNCFLGQIQGSRKMRGASKKRSCKLIKIPKIPPKIRGIFSAKSPAVAKNQPSAPLHRILKNNFIRQFTAPQEAMNEREGEGTLSLSERIASSRPLNTHLAFSKCLQQSAPLETSCDCSSHKMVPIVKEHNQLPSDWNTPLREEERQFQITRVIPYLSK